MTYNKLLLNLSMLGPAPTGLGVYSEHCAAYLEHRFRCSVVASHYKTLSGTGVIASPSEVAIGGGKFASLRRLWYMTRQFPMKDAFVYSPTHHGVIGFDKQVITIHDLISIHHPTQHKFQYYYFNHILPMVINRCKAVFTVSETARKDIAEFYGFPVERIFVIPNGVDTNIFHVPSPACPPLNGETAPYLLVVGASYPHKNIEELLHQSSHWREKYRIKIASSSGKHKLYLQGLVAQLDLTDRVEFLGYVTTEALVKLYQNCAALIFPSRWEGFGIPPLEAMACGRPAIISDIPVHKEVFGDAAIYITPGNSDSWIAAFKLLNDEEEVLKKIYAGRVLAGRYSWTDAGERLVASLLSVEPELGKFLKP